VQLVSWTRREEKGKLTAKQSWDDEADGPPFLLVVVCSLLLGWLANDDGGRRSEPRRTKKQCRSARLCAWRIPTYIRRAYPCLYCRQRNETRHDTPRSTSSHKKDTHAPHQIYFDKTLQTPTTLFGGRFCGSNTEVNVAIVYVRIHG